MMEPAIETSKRMGAVQLSEIVRISENAKRLKSAGMDILTLSTGEPDFSTPEHVVEAAIDAMRRGETKYTLTSGTIELRNAISRAAKRDSGYDCNPSSIIVGTGAKQVLFNALFATLNSGDEVIIPAPYWSNYADMVTMCGGAPVIVPTAQGQGLKITAGQLEAAISHRTRWLILNSPSNPAGAVYACDELRELAAVLRRNPAVAVMSDEIYQHISYVPYTSFLAAAPDLAHRILIVNGVSKAYAMTGWRIGWGIGPKQLIDKMVAVQGQSTSGASSISQAAAMAALDGPQDFLKDRANDFLKRRDVVLKGLNRISLLKCSVPDGAFYVYPSCREALNKTTPAGLVLRSDSDFCDYLLQSEGIAVVPGSSFGSPGYFRLSYAYSMETLQAAVLRIARACAVLR